VVDNYRCYSCNLYRFTLCTRSKPKYRLFTGGRNFKVQFENAVEPEQVRELISSKFGDANVSVIAIGTDKKTVRISTNYRIEEDGNNVDSEIEAYLYETLKPVLTQNITLETFIDRENHTGGSIVSSQKVGPSIADAAPAERISTQDHQCITCQCSYRTHTICNVTETNQDNDKVVIFDRVREFFGLYPKRDRKQLFNDSLNTTQHHVCDRRCNEQRR